MKKYIIALLAGLLLAGEGVYAQQQEAHKGLIWSALHGLDYSFKAGLNIGGTSPFRFRRKYVRSTVIRRDWPLHWKETLPNGWMYRKNGVYP